MTKEQLDSIEKHLNERKRHLSNMLTSCSLALNEVSRLRVYTTSAMLCEHANESPAICTCGDNCYCKTMRCK